jgi:uncharacterized protein YecE (DUF72 family)
VALYIGTSGWAYPEWKPAFYPDGLPRSRYLTHYSSILTACEINATFYRLQSPATIQNWLRVTPEGFRFTTKAHRRLTHARLFPVEGPGRVFLDEFLGSVEPLNDRLGAMLFQFPPHRERDDLSLQKLLAALPPAHRYAFEFRHPSWETPEVTGLIADRDATVCMAETEGRVPAALPPGPLAYVRLRFDAYSETARSQWRDLLIEESRHRDVFAFTKHEGVPAGDVSSGIGLAEWLAAQYRNAGDGAQS